jgi:hypothetical protein
MPLAVRLFSAAAFAFFAVSGAVAADVKYHAKLDSSSETPPNTSGATGEVDATYDDSAGTLNWTATYSGLTGPVTAAHFHGPAPTGKAAGVMVPATGPMDSPMKGSAKLTDEQVRALAEGQMYFNIHTAANKGGEIRGQMIMSAD